MKTFYAIMVKGDKAFVVKTKKKSYSLAYTEVMGQHTGCVVLSATEFLNLRKIKPILNEKVEI